MTPEEGEIEYITNVLTSTLCELKVINGETEYTMWISLRKYWNGDTYVNYI